MLSLLKRLKGLGEGEPAASPLETFGRARIARALGEEILESSADRKGRVQSIRDRLTAMTRFQKDDLIDRLFARLALFVFDLPASEANHHRERFGLLDHLLDVAERSAQALTGSGFQVSPEPSVNHREGPLWAYAGVIAAVAHD
ncbi:MAG TPA: TraI domain-containing protein, partial [Planctomycetota bacterium]|nr:TraI domain-containing protein [Planctomycetota bacterium]